MNEPITEKPVSLAIDLDQWRRDIQAFASTTKQALDGIVSELSNQCASSHLASDSINTSARPPIHTSIEPETSSLSKQPGFSDEREKTANREGRLANLKLKLAQRIAKNG